MRAIGKIRQRKLLNKLGLLSDCGAGLHAIASPFCNAVKELLGCRSTMLVWFDDNEQPLGFYHDTAPVELKDLFIARLDTLFMETEPVSALSLARPHGPLVGKALAPGVQAQFHAGNIYRHLCVPLGDHHLIDMRAHTEGSGFAGFFAWNDEARPFTDWHIEQLKRAQPFMQRALEAGARENGWRSLNKGHPHFVTCMEGQRLIAIDDEAHSILIGSQLLRQQSQTVEQPRSAPVVSKLLAHKLQNSGEAAIILPVPNGRLICRGHTTRFFDAGNTSERCLFVAMDLQQSIDVARIDHLMECPLTPLQQRIALAAMQRIDRAEITATLGVSAAAMKVHTKNIYGALNVHGWHDLANWVPAPA